MKPYYQDEAVTIYHGDCREILPEVEADVLVTDPPYGMGYGPRGAYNKHTGKWSAAPPKISGDNSTSIRDEVLLLWGDAPAAVFGTWRQPRPAGVQHRLIWWKQGATPGPIRAAFMLQDEEIYILGKGWRTSSPPLRSVLATTEGRSHAVSQIGHPTPKPIGLMERLIDRCPAGIIVDTFAGSGSTLMAAKNLGRKAIGIELEERYCEIAAQRCAQDVLDLAGAA